MATISRTGRSASLLLIAALMATAACTKKPPKELPPPPPSAGENSGSGAGQGRGPGDVGSATVPGSAADFRATVGTADTVLFATDSYDIDSEARALLDRQVQWLRQYPNVRITLEGHCDERGTREYNLALGDRRANSAKNYLAAQGIAASRISTISYGKERPVATGSDEGAWAQNRRAVTVVIDGAR